MGESRNTPALLTRSETSRQRSAADMTSATEVTSSAIGTIRESRERILEGSRAAA
jgi:hypothetical protein